jgi:hypothetical protein
MTDIETIKDYESVASELVAAARAEAGNDASPLTVWSILHSSKLTPDIPFDIHQLCYSKVYKDVQDVKPAWIPTQEIIGKTNIHQMMSTKGFTTYEQFYDYSIGDRNDFWMDSMKQIQIEWNQQPTSAFDGKEIQHDLSYFPNGILNISDSCFNKRPLTDAAIVYSNELNPRSLRHMSFATLNKLSNQIANALRTKLSLSVGDAVGICMPMNPESLAIYLGRFKWVDAHNVSNFKVGDCV